MSVLETRRSGDEDRSSDDNNGVDGTHNGWQPSRDMTLRPDVGLQTEHQVSTGGDPTWDARPTGDGDSEKAIMKTKTVTVSYG